MVLLSEPNLMYGHFYLGNKLSRYNKNTWLLTVVTLVAVSLIAIIVAIIVVVSVLPKNLLHVHAFDMVNKQTQQQQPVFRCRSHSSCYIQHLPGFALSLASLQTCLDQAAFCQSALMLPWWP